MKKILVALAAVTAMASASAATQWVNGVLYGNVCRMGSYYTVYHHASQPVGTTCPIRNDYGGIIGYGVVTNE